MKSLNRRDVLRKAAGIAATMTASAGVAKVCQVSTGEQPLGPFFPNPGTPVDPVREDQNSRVPIYFANDNNLHQIKGRVSAARGQVCEVFGTLTDRDCKPIQNANIVIWQAAASGRYNHLGDDQSLDFKHPKTGETIKREHDPNFQYWGRAVTDNKGSYNFKTVVPGFYPANLSAGWFRPPHIHFLVSALGHQQFITQLYFRGSSLWNHQFIEELNARDHLLQSSDLSDEQRENLTVDFIPTDFEGRGVKGQFDIQLP